MIKLNHTRTLPRSFLTIISRFATQISPRPGVFPGADRLPGSAFSLQPSAFSLSFRLSIFPAERLRMVQVFPLVEVNARTLLSKLLALFKLLYYQPLLDRANFR